MPLSAQQQDYRSQLVRADTSKPGIRFIYARVMGGAEIGHPGLAEGGLEMSDEDFDALVDHGAVQLVNRFQCIMTRSD